MKYIIKTPQGHYLIGQRVPGGPGERPMPLWSVDLQAAQLFDSPDAAFAATVYMQAGLVYEARVEVGAMFENSNKTEVARFPSPTPNGAGGKGGDAVATGKGSMAIGGQGGSGGGSGGAGFWREGVFYGAGGGGSSNPQGGTGSGAGFSQNAGGSLASGQPNVHEVKTGSGMGDGYTIAKPSPAEDKQ